MRRLASVVLMVLLLSGATATAMAHDGTHGAGGCMTGTGHGNGPETVRNPVTQGPYWIGPGGIYITGGTGYINADGSGIRQSNADGSAQARVGSGGGSTGGTVCVSAAGQTVK